MVVAVGANSSCWDAQDCLEAKKELKDTWKWASQEVAHVLKQAHSAISTNASKLKDRCVIITKAIQPCLYNRILPFLRRVFDPAAPNFAFQNKIDALGVYIEQKFAPLTKFNEWLNSNGQGAWYKQLAVFLAKLPLRAARNIILMVYNVIKGICKFCVHPVTFLHDLIKNLKALAKTLLVPETWSKMGIGMIGAGLGNAAVTGNPLSVIALGIGLAMLAGGLTAGAILSARSTQRGMRVHAVGQYLLGQAKQLPEVMLTGFLMGLIVGGIQRHLQKQQELKNEVQIKDRGLKLKEHEEFLRNYKPTSQDMREGFDQFLRDTGPSKYESIYYFSNHDSRHYLMTFENNIDRFLSHEFGREIVRESGITHQITHVTINKYNPADPKIYGMLTYSNPRWVNPHHTQCFAVSMSKFVNPIALYPEPVFAPLPVDSVIGQIHAASAPVGAAAPLLRNG